MQRFYVSPSNIKENNIYFSGEQVNYIKKVLRLKEGAEVAVTDGLGQTYLCRLLSFFPEEGHGEIIALLQEEKEPKTRVVLYQGIAKGDKMDQVVQKSVELGVTEIVPLITHRCVVKLEGSKGESKRQRWQKIAQGALEQSGRNILPIVRSPLVFEQAIEKDVKKDEENTLTLFPWEEAEGNTLRSVLNTFSSPHTVRIFIGPEGGFTSEEAQLAQDEGAKQVTLGPRILRTETAGPTVLALVLYHYNDI